MSKNLTEAVLCILNKDDEITKLKIGALKNEMLSYMNRKTITEEIFPVMVCAIAECIEKEEITGNVQSLSEGDMSVSYANTSPFFGKLESFKTIRGIE